MGKKSPPQPFIAPMSSVPDQVDRTELNKATAEDIDKAKRAKVSTKNGADAPQASLLAEREYWNKKESLLK
jgi:hypothetical protein